MAVNKTKAHHQKLTWYTPTQYCHFDPVLFDHTHLGVKGCTAALYNMCIEPDGSVLPCQSYYQSLGNFQTDTWETIWNHKLAVSLRERQLVKEECKSCSLLSICGGGCPLAQLNGRVSAPQTYSLSLKLKEDQNEPAGKKLKKTFFTRYIPLKPGVYHYQAPPEAEFPYRLHLRIEKKW